MDMKKLQYGMNLINGDKDFLQHYLDLYSIKGKKCLCIGFSEEEIKEYVAKYAPSEVICLTLWADHKDARIKKYKIIIGDITKRTPFRDSEFDAVITLSLLEHISDLNAAFLEVKRVLSPAGYFINFFGPAWSSCVGHHIYADPGDPLLNFSLWKMPGHIHLLASRDEITEYYLQRQYTMEAINGVFHWFYETPIINRVMYDDYLK